MKVLSGITTTAFAFLALANFASAQDRQYDKFQVSSTTFKNNSILPIIVVHNIVVNGSNGCSINGAPGGNESPELSWTDVPRGTASFVVITFDTLGFTHWTTGYRVILCGAKRLKPCGVKVTAANRQPIISLRASVSNAVTPS